MNNTQVTSGRQPHSARLSQPRSAARPAPGVDVRGLSELLESHLQALQTLEHEHRQMVALTLRMFDATATALRNDLQAIGNAQAPWVQALGESRALLYVALRELIVGAQAEHTATIAPHELAGAPRRTR